MIRTFLTVAFLTLKNRILQRIRRLRQPRYLIGAIAGAVYFWYMIFRRLAAAGNGRILLKTFGASPVVTDVASVVVLMIMTLAWALPSDSGGIEFSEAEIAFLFPAPLRRRDLLLYKILRAQPQALFSALIMTVLGWWRRGLFVGIWVTISALSIYFILVSLGRARLKLAHIGFIPRLLGVAAIVAGLSSLAIAEVRKLPPAAMIDAPSFFKAIGPNLAGAHSPFQKPLIRTILFIPHFFASAALPSSLASLALSSLAVITLAVVFFYLAAALNVSFEEASLSASQKRAARRGAGGRRRGSSVMFRRAPPPFRLQETGPVEVAIVWKNLIALMRNSIAWVVVFAATLMFLIGLALWSHEPSAYKAIGFGMLWIAAFFPLFATNIFANDLRLDMPRLEVLKSYPISGERLIAAEIAAPLVVISILEMLFAAAGSVLIGMSGETSKFAQIVATPQFIVTVLLLTLPICAVQLLIRNAVPVLFPAWAMRSKDEPRGFVASGQRLVTLAGNLLVLAVCLIPAAIVFLPSLWLAHTYFGGSAAFVGIAAMPAVAIIATEVWFGVKALGAQFDVLDVSNETDVLVS